MIAQKIQDHELNLKDSISTFTKYMNQKVQNDFIKADKIDKSEKDNQ